MRHNRTTQKSKPLYETWMPPYGNTRLPYPGHISTERQGLRFTALLSHSLPITRVSNCVWLTPAGGDSDHRRR